MPVARVSRGGGSKAPPHRRKRKKPDRSSLSLVPRIDAVTPRQFSWRGGRAAHERRIAHARPSTRIQLPSGEHLHLGLAEGGPLPLRGVRPAVWQDLPWRRRNAPGPQVAVEDNIDPDNTTFSALEIVLPYGKVRTIPIPTASNMFRRADVLASVFPGTVRRKLESAVGILKRERALANRPRPPNSPTTDR